GDGAAQSAIALGASGEEDEMVTDRVGDTVLRARQAEAELGAVRGVDAELLRCLREPDDAVHAVVVGQRDRVETETCRLFDQFLRVARPVEEAEVGVAVHFGVRDAGAVGVVGRVLGRGGAGLRRGLVAGALSGPGWAVATVARAWLGWAAGQGT